MHFPRVLPRAFIVAGGRNVYSHSYHASLLYHPSLRNHPLRASLMAIAAIMILRLNALIAVYVVGSHPALSARLFSIDTSYVQPFSKSGSSIHRTPLGSESTKLSPSTVKRRQYSFLLPM